MSRWPGTPAAAPPSAALTASSACCSAAGSVPAIAACRAAVALDTAEAEETDELVVAEDEAVAMGDDTSERVV